MTSNSLQISLKAKEAEHCSHFEKKKFNVNVFKETGIVQMKTYALFLPSRSNAISSNVILYFLYIPGVNLPLNKHATPKDCLTPNSVNRSFLRHATRR